MDETVSALCATHCAHIDAAHPGALVGLYLVGSIALGDYRPGASDVDFIAVLNQGLSRDDIIALHESLQTQFSRPHFDGIYVDTLTHDPRLMVPGFSVVDGHVRGPDREERHAVTWLTLARHGIAIRGRAPSADWVWNDVAAAQQHARENLGSYWRRQLDWHRSQLEVPGPLSDDMLVWAVLGVGRLHAMIAKGLLLSKGHAGEYERAIFPAHQAIIAEAIALRLGQHPVTSFGTPVERHAAVVDFLDAVIADGLAYSA